MLNQQTFILLPRFKLINHSFLYIFYRFKLYPIFVSYFNFHRKSDRINIRFRKQSKMVFLYQTVAIITLMVRLTFGGITNLQFNHVHTINQNSYTFSQITIAKVYENYLYVSQANQNIQKINLITGIQQGMFTLSSTGQTVNDFVVYANGTKMVASYSNDILIQWNTSSFANILNVSTDCYSLIYLEDINRFICSIQNFSQLEMRLPDLSTANIYYQFSVDTSKHKFVLSSDGKSILDINEQRYFSAGSFSYTNSSLQFTQIVSGSANDLSYVKSIYTAETLPSTFYITILSQVIYLIDITGNFDAYDYIYPDRITTFRQIVNDRVAFVMQNTNQVNFNSMDGLNFSHVFSIPEAITAFQITVDKTKLILIFQSQIQVYQFACSNQQYFNPTIFDCMPCFAGCLTCYTNSPNCSSCLPGQFVDNQTCSACHSSCQTCQNSTGCLICAGNLTQIQFGLLCSNLTNASLNQNGTKTIYSQILGYITYFISIPSAVRIPIQSSILIYIADFWIYNYHNRTYGQKVSQVFQIIQIIESHKWALAKFDKHLNITLDLHYLGFSNYSNYSNPKFLEIEKNSSTFFESLQQYFLYFTPTVILLFLLYRLIFYVTFNYQVSRYFRRYSFNAFIIFVLTEGNLEYLCYCCFNQSQMLYFFNFIDKINAWVWLLFFFLATIHAFGTFYLTYWFYPKLGDKFIDEARKMLPSFTMYTIITNGKNFILAAVQSFLFKFYVAQMFLMLGVHFILIGIMLYFQLKYGVFKRAIFLNFLLLQTVIKILVNFLFLIQYYVKEGDNATFDILEDSLMIVLYLWGTVVILGVISSFFPQKKRIKKEILADKNKKQENNQQCYSLNDQLNNIGDKAEIEPEKNSKSIKEKLKNSVRFANRQDVKIIQYYNREPMQPINQKQKQVKIQKTQFPSKSNNKRKIGKIDIKIQNKVNYQQKNRIHKLKKVKECIFILNNCSNFSQNDIQEIKLKRRLK